jgi:hypothetical protein
LQWHYCAKLFLIECTRAGCGGTGQLSRQSQEQGPAGVIPPALSRWLFGPSRGWRICSAGCDGQSTNARQGWHRAFDDPIPLPDGGTLITLHDAATFIRQAAKARA